MFSFELPGVVVVVRSAPQIVIAFLIGTLACVGHRGSGKLPASWHFLFFIFPFLFFFFLRPADALKLK